MELYLWPSENGIIDFSSFNLSLPADGVSSECEPYYYNILSTSVNICVNICVTEKVVEG